MKSSKNFRSSVGVWCRGYLMFKMQALKPSGISTLRLLCSSESRWMPCVHLWVSVTVWLISGQQAWQPVSVSAGSPLALYLRSNSWVSFSDPLSLVSIVKIHCYKSIWNCDCYKLGVLAVVIISLIQSTPSSQLPLTLISCETPFLCK